LHKKPFSLLDLSQDVELLAIPFQKEYSGYRDWKVPAKNKAMRIILAHGTVNGFFYTGCEEEENSILDEDMFSFFQANLAAMGHIHKRMLEKKGNTTVAYPGSARVWREGEEGKRHVYLGTTNPAQLTPLPLASAGEYRNIPVFVTPKGELRAKIPDDLSKKDWLNLDVTGVVEDEVAVMAALGQYKAELEKRCRKVSSRHENLSVLSGISTHPLAISFLKVWEEKESFYAKEEPGVYDSARIQGLSVIKEFMESQK
jgi:DNA repair exonuclease SbcCD nuclease subunit